MSCLCNMHHFLQYIGFFFQSVRMITWSWSERRHDPVSTRLLPASMASASPQIRVPYMLRTEQPTLASQTLKNIDHQSEYWSVSICLSRLEVTPLSTVVKVFMVLYCIRTSCMCQVSFQNLVYPKAEKCREEKSSALYCAIKIYNLPGWYCPNHHSKWCGCLQDAISQQILGLSVLL